MYLRTHRPALTISQKSRWAPNRCSNDRANRSRSSGSPPGPVGHSYVGKVNCSAVRPSSKAVIAGQDRSVRWIAPLMKPWVRESPTVTSRCLAGFASAGVTSIPSLGSVSGSRGLLRISTSSGVVRLFAIAAPPSAWPRWARYARRRTVDTARMCHCLVGRSCRRPATAPRSGGSGRSPSSPTVSRSCVQGHRAAEVDRELEQQVRARVADGDVPPRVVVRDEVVVEEVEVLLRGADALALRPQPLGVRREALVEPDLASTAATARLSPYHWWASSWTTTPSPETGSVKKSRGVDRAASGSPARTRGPRCRRRSRRADATGSGPKTLGLRTR